MKLTNESPYHTATLRKIISITYLALKGRPARSWHAQVFVEEGRTRLTCCWVENQRTPTLRLRVPKLTGAEFIPLLRQQHGGVPTNVAHSALKSTEVALMICKATAPTNWYDPDARKALVRAKIPQYVPLRIRKPPKEEGPRDIVAERYERVLALEKKWRTKLKLAQTKLKKLRSKRYHYEKKLSTKNQEAAS